MHKMGPCSTRGCPGGPTMWADAPWPRPSLGRILVAPGAQQASPHGESPPHPFSLPTFHFAIAQTHVLAVLAQDFRSTCSAHHFCWDLDHLLSGMWILRLSNRFFVNGVVYLEYFAAIGNLFSELACLCMSWIISFDAWFSSLLVPIVLPMNFSV